MPSNPTYISKDELPADATEKAKEVFAPELEGKPEDMKEKIRHLTMLSIKDIGKVFSNNPKLYNTGDKFGKKYLEVAGDGDRHEEFEIMTNQILKKTLIIYMKKKQ